MCFECGEVVVKYSIIVVHVKNPMVSLDISTRELLEKFGTGEHIPGSGSAAAFHGLLSARLLQTVISLTLSKPKYESEYCRFCVIQEDISDRLYPRLEKLFHTDSITFNKVIQARRARNEAKSNPMMHAALELEALDLLRECTQIPLDIARLCVELGYHATKVFDYGFQSARGDSSVALQGVVAAIGGCLAIVDLNLSSFKYDQWAVGIRTQTLDIGIDHIILQDQVTDQLTRLRSEADSRLPAQFKIEDFRSGQWDGTTLSPKVIEQVAIKLQRSIWKDRDRIWRGNAPSDQIDTLDPQTVLTLFDYQFNKVTSLGVHESQRGSYDVAGTIDNDSMTVEISEKFPFGTQNFTAAHELGHVLLHRQQSLHRDRPLNGSAQSGYRNRDEREADQFATFFLMPSKDVRRIFHDLFQIEKFHITDDTAFNLISGSVEELKAKCKDLRSLAYTLASTESYGGLNFKSMAQRFKVSNEAMAIRLEELELLEL